MEDIFWNKLFEKKKANLIKKVKNTANKFLRINYDKNPSISITTKFKFLIMRSMQKTLYKKDPEYVDAKYWKEQDWLDNKRPW